MRIKTIHKFMLKSYLGPMVLTFFIVMFVLLMQFMWRYIDELVGRGITLGTILEFMGYASATLIPMGLPLATMLAAIMTMGNLGENYELQAMKSAGMSLPRIIMPLMGVVIIVATASFFVTNNLVPYSMKKIYGLIYDIRKQNQNLEFKDGIFFNGIDNMSIRVGYQNPKTKLLRDVLIYDNSGSGGNMMTTVADSGYIRLSDDKKFMLVTLYNGVMYEQTRNYQWYDKSALKQNKFHRQVITTPMEGFAFERSEASLLSNSQTKNVVELQHDIDSLRVITERSERTSYTPLLESYIFPREKELAFDTIELDRSYKRGAYLPDSIDRLDVYQTRDLYNDAKNLANSSRGYFTFDEQSNKEALSNLYRSQVEWHRKISLPFSIIIFFLIGAPLGAIIRKGGLGMPIVVSVSFFIIYYIVSITGEKMVREGTWGAFQGMWFSTLILLPIAIFLTYKASRDSNLFNADLIMDRIRQVRTWIKNKTNKK